MKRISAYGERKCREERAEAQKERAEANARVERLLENARVEREQARVGQEQARVQQEQSQRLIADLLARNLELNARLLEMLETRNDNNSSGVSG